MKKLGFLLLSLTLLLASAQSAAAAGPEGTFNQPEKVQLSEKLNLSDAQMKQLQQLNQSHYKATRDLRIKIMDARYELRQLGLEKSDQSTRDAKIKEIKGLQVQIRKADQESWQKVQSILTPEQIAQLKEIKRTGHHYDPSRHCQ